MLNPPLRQILPGLLHDGAQVAVELFGQRRQSFFLFVHDGYIQRLADLGQVHRTDIGADTFDVVAELSGAFKVVRAYQHREPVISTGIELDELLEDFAVEFRVPAGTRQAVPGRQYLRIGKGRVFDGRTRRLRPAHRFDFDGRGFDEPLEDFKDYLE